MSFLTVAAIVGTGTVLTGMGLELSGYGQPSQPNLSASSAQLAETEAELLPELRAIQSEAQLGAGTTLVPGYTSGTRADFVSQLAELEQQPNKSTLVKSQISALKKAINQLPFDSTDTVYFDSKGKLVPASKATVDFTGYGTADVQGAIMEKLARGQLDLSKKYDPQFIAAALEQEKLADPEGFAARQELYDLIQKQIQNPPTSPVSEEMQRQVESRVKAGSGLTADEQALLHTAVSGATADRGGGNPPADFSRDLTTGFAGEKRALDNATAGTAWLASGETPEDIAYRSELQNLANLSNYVQGRTPQSQFGELSGAQRGPTPVVQSPALPTLPGNAAQVGSNAAVDQYGAQVQNALNMPNPWMAGLSGLLDVGNLGASLGWKPFKTS